MTDCSCLVLDRTVPDGETIELVKGLRAERATIPALTRSISVLVRFGPRPVAENTP